MPTIKSWLGVYKQESKLIQVDNSIQLSEAIGEYPEAKVIGSSHSYNKQHFADVVIKLGGQFDFIRLYQEEEVIDVGAATTIEKVMNVLAMYGFKLRNSGNHRKQTLVGAMIGGTHGFGYKSTMAEDATFRVMREGKEVLIKAQDFKRSDIVMAASVPVERVKSYKVVSCTCKLSELEFSDYGGKGLSFLVMPYSDKEDPTTIITSYSELPTTYTFTNYTKKYSKIMKVPLKLKAFWMIDRCFPPLRRWLQRTLNFLRIPPLEIITAPNDIDALYHPWPWLDNQFDFKLWAFKPTYTSHNMSLFIETDRVKEFVTYAASEADRIKKGFLRAFIGCRYLSDNSEIPWAGNFGKPMVAVDFYCNPSDVKYMEKLELSLRMTFSDTIPHASKTVYSSQGQALVKL